MKKLILTVALAGFCASALAQGTLNFGNANAQVNAPIWIGAVGAPNLKPSGGTYTAQLWWGAAGSTEAQLVAHPTTATFSTVAAQAGYFFGGERVISGVAGGTAITVQVRVFDTASGSWASALEWGKSSLFNVTLAVPPATPANLVGLTSFAIVPVPEPSTFALAGLGAAAMLIFRRRK